ncbi:hypothetical protein U1Q18_036219, partial [Sarracenia purpurea var. burkii]
VPDQAVERPAYPRDSKPSVSTDANASFLALERAILPVDVAELEALPISELGKRYHQETVN